MRSRQILSILLKKYDMNFHVDENAKFNVVIFDNKTGKRLESFSDDTLPKLLRKCMKFSYSIHKPKTL
jgi:hypothetical protein